MPQPVSPVVPGLEEYEQIWKSKDPNVVPLPLLRSKGPEYKVYSRWVLTDAERKLVLEGADIYLVQQTHGNSFQPSALVVNKASDNEANKGAVLELLGLDEELNERLAILLDKAFEG